MDDAPQIPDTVWEDIARSADLADELARQGRTVRFRRGARPCQVEVELIEGSGGSVRTLRPGDIADVELLAALVTRD